MEMNIRIAKELMRLAKMLAAGDWDDEEDNGPKKSVEDMVNGAIAELAGSNDAIEVNPSEDGEGIYGKISASGGGDKGKNEKRFFLVVIQSYMNDDDACVEIMMNFVENGKNIYGDTSYFKLRSDFADNLYKSNDGSELWYCNGIKEEDVKTNLKNIFDKVVKKLKSIAPKIVKKIEECIKNKADAQKSAPVPRKREQR